MWRFILILVVLGLVGCLLTALGESILPLDMALGLIALLLLSASVWNSAQRIRRGKSLCPRDLASAALSAMLLVGHICFNVFLLSALGHTTSPGHGALWLSGLLLLVVGAGLPAALLFFQTLRRSRAPTPAQPDARELTSPRPTGQAGWPRPRYLAWRFSCRS